MLARIVICLIVTFSVFLICFQYVYTCHNCRCQQKDKMDESNVLIGTKRLEQLVNNSICQNHLSTHVCEYTRNHHFRALFRLLLCTVFLLWTLMDVDVEGPIGRKCIHMLWMLLFLKEYSNDNMLARMCGMSRKTWVDDFIDCASNIDLVSTSICWIVVFVVC